MKTLDKKGTLWTVVPFFGAVPRTDLERLLRVLNDPKQRARSRRVVAFIRELRAVKSARPRTAREASDACLRVLDIIHSKVERARFFLDPHYRVSRGSASAGRLARWNPRLDWRVEVGQLNVIDSCYVTVALLDSSGEFEKLTECAGCGTWYLRRKRSQDYHDEKCRRKAYRQTPQWKAKNRQYVQDYYDTYLKSRRAKRKRKVARHEK